MALGGVDGFADLAARISERNYGATNLRLLNDQDQRRTPRERIAEACGLPYEFFTVDFDRIPELEKAPAEEAPTTPDVAAELQSLREALEEQAVRLGRLELADQQRADEEHQPKRDVL